MTNNIEEKYYVAERGGGPEAAKAWFNNLFLELRDGHLDAEDRALLARYYGEAGLLRHWRRPFFMRHYAETLSTAADFLFGGKAAPTLLDLGCGTGTQSLWFALLGARVIGVDMDTAALGVMRKRIRHYEKIAGRRLEIEVLEGSVFDVLRGVTGEVDGVYSLFAFNLMQPTARLLDMLTGLRRREMRLAILDGNSVSVWNRYVLRRRRSVLAPRDLAAELARRGGTVVSQRGGVALPPVLWRCLPYPWARGLDEALCAGDRWPISAMTLAIVGPRSAEVLP